MAVPTQLTLTTELADRYEALARQRGQPREDLLFAALADYLNVRAAEEARLDAAIAAAARGELVDAAVVHAEEEAMMEGAYGTPPCG